MRQIVSDFRAVQFVSMAMGISFNPPYTAMGIEQDGRIIGGVVFNCFEGFDVHMSVAGRGWSAGFLAEVGHYLFDVLKVERVTAITEQPSVVRLAEKLGGQIEGCLRNHFGKGRDGFVVGILREEWKY